MKSAAIPALHDRAVFGGYGEVDSIITSSVDVTQVRKAEARERAVIESAPDPIVIFNADGDILDFNPAAENAFQRRRDEVLGQSAMILVAPRYFEAFVRWTREGKAAGSSAYAGRIFEAAGRRSDGTEFPMQVVITDLPGTSQLAAAFLRDLTLRDRLKESRERLASVVSSAPVIVLACDVMGTITLADGSGLVALGLMPDDVVGRSLRTLLEWRPDALELIDRMLGGSSAAGKLHAENPETYLGAAASQMLGPDGAVTGISIVLFDLTARIRAEEAHRESEAKSRLMAMMNHEVRTPLNSILGFARLLKDPDLGPLSDKQQRYVANIEASGRHLLELVNDSLDLAQLDIGRVRIELAAFPVQAALDLAADQMRPLAAARGLNLQVDPSDGLLALADRRQLVQVLLNLLSNAIRHSQPGDSVALAARRDGAQVAVTVVDTGDGIAPEDQARLFEEFFQAGNHAPGGIGLGLAISRRFVELMGGTIEVESRLGRGSTFTVHLRAAQAAP